MRFEKGDAFVEIVLEGARVHVAKGSRKMTDADVRTYLFDGDESLARESFEDRQSEAERNGFALVSEESPIVRSYVVKRDVDRIQKDAQALLSRGSRGKTRDELVAEAQSILDRWHAAVSQLDEITADSLGTVYGERITQLEELIRGG
jgi:hypothetical protein